MAHAIRIFRGEEPPPPAKKRKRRLPKFLRKNELDDLLSFCDGQINSFGEAKNHSGRWVCSVHVYRAFQQDKLILVLGAYVGLRVSEMTGLTVEDINLTDRDVFIRGKGDADRYLPIGDKAFPVLEAWCKFRKSGLLLRTRRGRRMLTTNVNYRLERMERLSGLKRHLHCHVLRHTHAVMLLEAGADIMDIKELLGHRHISCTAIYLSCSPAKLRRAVDKL